MLHYLLKFNRIFLPFLNSVFVIFHNAFEVLPFISDYIDAFGSLGSWLFLYVVSSFQNFGQSFSLVVMLLCSWRCADEHRVV
jgi:hypothetical protein